MKIYLNEKEEIVIDGDGCTIINVPKDFNENGQGVKGWMKNRINLGDKVVLFTNFNFIVSSIFD